MGVYDVTWSLSGVDSIRWGLQSVSMWRPPVTVRRTSLAVPGRHGAISAGLPVFEEPTVSLTMWLHGSTQDDIEDAALELVGLLTAPGLTLSRTSGNLVTSAPASLVSVTPDEFTTAAEATFEVVLAIPSALLRADVVDSTLTAPGAVPGLTGSTGPVGDAVLRVKDPDDFELTDVVSGTGISWSGTLPGWLLFIDTATLRAWLSQDPNAWAGGASGTEVRTNQIINPQGTTTSNTWGYQAGTGESAATSLVTDASDGPVLPDGTRLKTYVRRTITAAKTGGSSGPWCRSPNGAYSAVAGDVVSPTMYVRFSVEISISSQSQARNVSAAAGISSVPMTIPANTWIRVGQSATVTGPADNTQVWAVLAAGAILPVGATVDTTAGQSEDGPVTPYHDGDTEDTAFVTNAWTGPPNASTSTQTIQLGKATVPLDFPPAGRLQLWPRMPSTNPAERTARVAFSGASEVVVRARPAYL